MIMFGLLKKRLKEVLKKSKKIEEEPEEIKKDETSDTSEEIKESKRVPEVAEKVDEETEKNDQFHIPLESKEVREGKEIKEREKVAKIIEDRRSFTPEETDEKKEKSIFKRFVKRVSEKTLTEKDIENILKELRMALLENDVAFPVVEKLCDDVKQSLLNKGVKRTKVDETIKESLRNSMLEVMQAGTIDLNEKIKSKKPFVILFLGFNGTGKTTTIAKFANMFMKDYKIVLAAGDTFRAASIEQLEEHAKKLGLPIIKHKYGADSAAVIFDAIKYAKAHAIDIVLADTAGRSHSNVNLMDELKKICRVNKPDLKILILDSLTGNDIYEQSKQFDEAVGIDAIILTKADVYEKGGAALSASYTIKKPILFLGTGQEYSCLQEFKPKEIVDNLLG